MAYLLPPDFAIRLGSSVINTSYYWDLSSEKLAIKSYPILRPNSFKNIIIAPFKYHRTLTARYPKRKVIADAMMPDDRFYFWTKRGRLVTVLIRD